MKKKGWSRVKIGNRPGACFHKANKSGIMEMAFYVFRVKQEEWGPTVRVIPVPQLGSMPKSRRPVASTSFLRPNWIREIRQWFTTRPWMLDQ